ncbi:NADP-dependent 3-hydroxy acid dehydrogenase YdfG [Arthrobacter sp. 9V]|uniref:SDR family NAD(P)-dependent oxidoreductase n=1 Tax=Arthrobacter sp. 9V TaxID=2653132 RepID=UPI0012EF87C5|nr:SDR family oxidoreductase [Arthrobacter sp. 9V]VXC42734.1 NADP-dependent 3-hydroxy acid dehydrogenase YdfG [Arthrobacter sp. 9V]
MDLQLASKRAIVTGGSRGIGFAVAEALVAEGAHVALVARGREGLNQAKALLARHNGKVLAISADSNDDPAVREAVASTVREFGGVDILVNAAARPGNPLTAPALQDLTDDDLRTEVETKVLGYLRFARAAAPHMARQGWGRIINISGLAARQTGLTFGSIRNVAVAAMTKNLADELGPAGINVTVVHPGFVITERTPMLIAAQAASSGTNEDEVRAVIASRTSIGRLVTAAEVANVVAFLASPRSVSITGDAIAVAGGVPGPIHY